MVLFKKIRWKNFLSTGNYFTEIDLNRNTSTLIVGSNGSGKSTMLDALTFALFGKPFRNINKPTLINSINEKQCVVEVEFSIGNKEYKVVRGIKPNIFEIYCDDKLIDQTAANKDYQEILEKQILKLNFKSFTQIVILGSASFTPFMQLKAADRREIIEDLLDIKIFSSMHTIIKQKISLLKEKEVSNKYALDLCVERIKMQKNHIEQLKKHNLKEIEKKQKEIDESNINIKKYTKDVQLIDKHVQQLLKGIEDQTKIDSKYKSLILIESKIESNISNLLKEKTFYESNDNCPTCKQHINESFKKDKFEQVDNKIQTQMNGRKEVGNQIELIRNRLQEISNVLQKIQEHQTESVRINASIQSLYKYVEKLEKEKIELSNVTSNIQLENDKLKELKTELKKYLTEQEKISLDRHYYDFSYSLLKDSGIKTKIIKQYLPIMNKLINKYLTTMDSFINFNLDESFNESIKSRYRDDFSYNNFSEGEKQKIDLALLFTWRQIAKIKNSTNTNLLILDEVFDSSLDASSVELLMNILSDVSKDTNVFVISHKGDQLSDKFRSVITFEKKNNFSRMIV